MRRPPSWPRSSRASSAWRSRPPGSGERGGGAEPAPRPTASASRRACGCPGTMPRTVWRSWAMRAEPCPVNDGNGPRIEPCTLQSLEEWAILRHALWPEAPVQDHLSEAQAMLWEQKKAAAFLVRLPDGTAAGFAEAALRH